MIGTAVDQDTRQWSWLAILSVPIGLMFCFFWGTFAILLGAVGLWQTRGGRRRGRKAAAWGTGLGCLSLLMMIGGMGFFAPPIHGVDRQLQTFFDNLAQGRWEQARANPLWQQTKEAKEWPLERFEAWSRYFRAKGRCRIWLVNNIVAAGEVGCCYYVRCERGRMDRCEVWFDDGAVFFNFGDSSPSRLEAGQSALHLAASNGEADVGEELLRQGEAVNAVDAKGQTPLDCLRTYPWDEEVVAGKRELEQELLRHGAISGLARKYHRPPFTEITGADTETDDP